MKETKFKVGDEVLVHFNDVSYRGKVVLVCPELFASEQQYVIKGPSLYLHNKNTGKSYQCCLEFQVWPETCINHTVTPVLIGEYKAEISPDGQTIKVGCQTISRETVIEVLDKMNNLSRASSNYTSAK
jgi:hypothetical protein